MNLKKQVDARQLAQIAVASLSDYEIDVFAVSDKAMRNAYLDDDGEPTISYDAESWKPVRACFMDNENSDLPVLLIVYEDDTMEDEEALDDGNKLRALPQ